jgi:hypothetical protein
MFRRLALAAAVAATLAACTKPEPAPPPAAPPDAGAGAAARALAAISASCADAVGEVQVRRSGQSDWQPVATGSVFRAGDVVRTGAGAFARIEFVAGGGLEIEENASVVIDAAPGRTEGSGAPAAENRISVESGVVRGFLPAAAGGEAPLGLVIRSAEGEETRLAAGPGEKPASFRLTRGQKGTEVAVLKGEVSVNAGQGAEKVVRSGQAVDVAQGGVGEVTELIDFPASADPGIDARFLWASDLVVRLVWRPVARASGYRVQLARDLAFQGIEKTLDVQGTAATFTPRAEGVYAWRVASRDAAGRLGEYGFARRIYFEKEQPRDLLVGPPDAQVVKYADQPTPIAFTWQSAGDARSYRLVIVKGRDLAADPYLALTTPGQRIEVAGLTAGEYVWGVYVDDRKTPEPIFVKPRALSVQLTAKPKVKVPRSITDWGR